MHLYFSFINSRDSLGGQGTSFHGSVKGPPLPILFQKPMAWKILDFIIGCVMWLIALSLILGLQDIGCAVE
jgi:hypothetical protein